MPDSETTFFRRLRRSFRRILIWGSLGFLLCIAIGSGVVFFFERIPPETTIHQLALPVQSAEIDPMETLALSDDSPFRADCWPGWRGYNGQGISPNNSPPIHFGPDQSIVWKIEVPGKGYSSPIIWENHLFLTSEVDKVLFLFCYDRTNGSLFWKKEVGKAQGHTHSENGYASSTPTTDGKHIFSFFGATGLFCHDFEGNEIWKVDLSQLNHSHGLASSPILYGDSVIMLCDNADHSSIIAFEKSTGKEIWNTPRKSGGGWTTPILVTVATQKKVNALPGKENSAKTEPNVLPNDLQANERTELLVNGGCPTFLSQGTFCSYDPETGKELWFWSGPVAWGIPTPLISKDAVYLFCGRFGRLVSIQLGGNDTDSQAKLLWERTKSSPYIASGVLYRSRLYVPSDRRAIDCYNPGNGQPLFQTKSRESFYASLLAADGRIYAMDRSGHVLVLEAGNEEKILAETDLKETCFASPAVADNHLFIRTETKLYCFGDKSK